MASKNQRTSKKPTTMSYEKRIKPKKETILVLKTKYVEGEILGEKKQYGKEYYIVKNV